MNKRISTGIICFCMVAVLITTTIPHQVADEIADNYLYDRLQETRGDQDIPTFDLQDSNWWNANWDYKKEITVSNKLDEYQTFINVTKSSGGDVDCEGHCNNNFSDLRFTQSDESTLIPYWVEEYASGSYAHVWVNNSNNESTLYMYYGNSSASNASDGNATFDFYDDFNDLSDGASLDSAKWDVTEDDYIRIEATPATTGGVYDGTNCVFIDCDGDDSGYNDVFSKPIQAGYYVVHFDTVFVTAGNDHAYNLADAYGLSCRNDTASFNDNEIGREGDGIIDSNDGSSYGNNLCSFSYNTWYDVDFWVDDNKTEYIKLNGGTTQSVVAKDTCSAGWTYFRFPTPHKKSSRDTFLDNIYFTKWTSGTEPSFSFGSEEQQIMEQYDSNWSYNRSITFNSSQIPSNLTNFPVCINITDSHLANNAQADGDDILFTADNISKLNHEIELYNSTTGHLVAWVNITELSGSTDTIIWMYYGNATCNSQENPTNVWDGNYEGVWHFSETGTGTRYDSTANGWNASTANFDGDEKSAAVLGLCDSLDGTNEYLQVAKAFNVAEGTVEIVFNPAVGESGGRIISKNSASTNSGDYILDYNISGNKKVRSLQQDTGTQDVVTDGAVAENEWHYIANHFEGTMKLFVDGSWQADTDSCADGIQRDTEYLRFGASETAAEATSFEGKIDELRISNAYRSDDWITTTYNTMMNATDGGFFDIGSIPLELDEWQYNRSITFNSSQIPSNLTNFPVCINITDTHLKNNAQADGDDILFTADNITKLNHEIELYNSTTGHLVAWVNVTELSGSTDTVIWMYYGNATCDSQESATDTWDDHYMAVWHLNDTDWLDSTSNNVDLTAGDAPTIVDTHWGKGADFDGTKELSHATFLDGAQNNMTVEYIFLVDADTANEYFHIFKQQGAGLYVSFSTRYDDIQSLWDNGELETMATTGDVVSNETYYYHGAALNGGNYIKAWLDGDIYYNDSHADTWSAGTQSDFQIGGYSPQMQGILDEIRVSDVTRSDDWIISSYNSMNNATDGGFFTLEPFGPTNTAPNTPTSPECQNMTWSDTDHLTDHTPYFDWIFSDSDANDTQHGFQIQVGNDTDWGTVEMWNYSEDTSNNFTIYNGSTLQDGDTYYWRVRVKDNDSAWSDYTANQQFRMNSVPTTPSLVSPGNNSKNLPYTPHSINLTWSAASDAETDSLNYWWQYARDSDFTIDIHGGWSTGPTYKTIPQTENLLEQTDYYWRVRAWDGHENGTWSNWRTFETDEIIDLTDLTIADGAENISIDTALWEINITHNDGYAFDWWINTTPDIGNNSQMADSSGIKNTSLSNLWYNTTYSVQVVVNGAQGAKRNETYTFTTEAFYDDDATPPTNAQVNQTTNSSLNLTWTNDGNNRTIIIRNETGVSAYNTDLVNATELYNGTGTQYEDTDLTQGITYYYTFWSYNETTGLYSATYAEANNTVKVLSLSISVSPHSYDFESVTIPGIKESTDYTFNITNDGLDASIAINVSNSQNWSFVNFSERGLDAFCMNWSDDNWTSEENIKTTGTTITSNLMFDMSTLFDLRLISPVAISQITQQEQWTITITATPS